MLYSFLGRRACSGSVITVAYHEAILSYLFRNSLDPFYTIERSRGQNNFVQSMQTRVHPPIFSLSTFDCDMRNAGQFLGHSYMKNTWNELSLTNCGIF